MHEIVIIIAKYFIAIPVLATLVLWFKLPGKLKKQYVALLVLGAILTLALAKIGSKFFYDPRPFVVGHFTPYFAHGNDNGFPSDHTLLASLLAFAAARFSKKLALILLVVAVLIGFARVIAGVHHLVDVVGSMCFAAVGVVVAYFLLRAVYRRPDTAQIS